MLYLQYNNIFVFIQNLLCILIHNYNFSSKIFIYFHWQLLFFFQNLYLFQLTIIIFHPIFLIYFNWQSLFFTHNFYLFDLHLLFILFLIGRGTFSVSKRISKSPVIFLFQVINTSRFYGDLPLSLKQLLYINTIV